MKHFRQEGKKVALIMFFFTNQIREHGFQKKNFLHSKEGKNDIKRKECLF